MSKAEQFSQAAEAVRALADDENDVADAYVTLCVHAGIAAADAICIARLGHHSRGEDHRQAVDLLETADKGAAAHLNSLLRMKSRAGYGHQNTGRTDVLRAGRAMGALLAIARDAHG